MARLGPFSAVMRCALLLALLAVGLRVAVPDGMMLQSTSLGHGVEVVVCTGHGPLQLTLDASGKPVSETQDKAPGRGKSQPACPYALLGMGMTATLGLAVPQPTAVAYTEIAPAGIYATPSLGLASPPPYTTGPPSIV